MAKATKIPFQQKQATNRAFGRTWYVDYEIKADSQFSLVMVLSTGSQTWARRVTERVVTTCADLLSGETTQSESPFISLFNDSIDVWREEDFALVSTWSRVATWSRRT